MSPVTHDRLDADAGVRVGEYGATVRDGGILGANADRAGRSYSMGCEPVLVRWPPLRLTRMRCERESVVVVAIWQEGVVRSAGRIETRPEALRLFADSLCENDEVALEATCSTHAIARLLERHVGRVVVSNPMKTRAIAEAKVKTDKVDARVLAQLLAARFLPSVWLADEETQALRRQVARRAHIVRQRTRLKSRVQAILHRNLVPRCPAADLFGQKGRRWLAEQELAADERQAVEALLRQLDFHSEELKLIDASLARVALARAE
jgi:transposase